MKLKTGDQNLISRWEDKIQPNKRKDPKKKSNNKITEVPWQLPNMTIE